MKRWREGTLRGVELTQREGDDLLGGREKFPRSLYGLHDFLAKSEALVSRMMTSGPRRAATAKALKQEVDRIRALLEKEPSQLSERVLNPNDPHFIRSALYGAVCAGLRYASLMHELDDDQPARGKRKRLTRTAYFEAQKVATTREQLTEMLDISDQGLRKWENKNLDDNHMVAGKRKRRR